MSLVPLQNLSNATPKEMVLNDLVLNDMFFVLQYKKYQVMKRGSVSFEKESEPQAMCFIVRYIYIRGSGQGWFNGTYSIHQFRVLVRQGYKLDFV